MARFDFTMIGSANMMYLFILFMLCVITSQAAPKDIVVTNLIVETTTSASNRIDNSEYSYSR